VFSSIIYQCSNSHVTSITPNTRITSITGNFDFPNLSDVDTVEILSATMTFIPDFALVTKQLPEFNKLYINHSGLKYVERRQLAKISQLIWLNVQQNLIEHLPEDVFSDLMDLFYLSVSANLIKVLPPKLLWNLPKLSVFEADGNQIELIPRDFFKNNRQLVRLWINGNKITRIEVDLTLLPELNGLRLSNNPCSDEFCNPCNIEKLRKIQQKINRNCAGIA
jgi:Leucine-rich repeat (LRR) protein